jgi:hypothetical protein
MMSLPATFLPFKIRRKNIGNFLTKAQLLADEENVSLHQYLGAMLRHFLLGHDLSKIHFYQDGSGDTYNEDVIDRLVEEAHAESAAGLTTVGETKEKLFAHLRELRKAVDAGKEVG